MARDSGREHPGWKKIASAVAKKAPATSKKPEPPPEIVDADLPGTCPYDKAVANGRLTYAEAKTRDELHTRAELAKIELETATLTLEARKLEIAQERGTIVSKEEYLERQEVMVSTFLELLRLAVTDVTVRLPSTQRDVATEEVLHKCNNAMTALATATAERKPREVAAQAMFDAFRGEQ